MNKGYLTGLIEELTKCDFTLFEEFLSKVKIFQSQSNEISFKKLTKKPNYTCKGSPSVANSIYTKFEGFSKWCEKVGNVVWLSKNSKLWQDVVKYLITGIKEISEPVLRKLERVVYVSISSKYRYCVMS